MAQSSNYKAPPTLTKGTSYETWKKEVKIWEIFTSLDKKKQAPAILLTLNGQSREAALELDIADLNCDNGVKNLMKKLDDLYLKDSQHLAYEAYEEFEKYCQPAKNNNV